MRKRYLELVSAVFLISVTSMWSISSRAEVHISRANAKAILGFEAGKYTVQKTEKFSDKSETICAPNAVHSLEWIGQGENLLLVIGERLQFSDFNAGLVKDTEPSYEDHCVYNHSTQTQSKRLIHDLYTTCDSASETEHIEIQAQGSDLEYTFQQTVAKKGMAKVTHSMTCLLKKKRG